MTSLCSLRHLQTAPKNTNTVLLLLIAYLAAEIKIIPIPDCNYIIKSLTDFFITRVVDEKNPRKPSLFLKECNTAAR